MARKGLLLFLIFGFFFARGELLRVYFIDVGEGEATLIQTPDGKNVLIDTGSVISGFRVAEFLRKNNVRKLDALIITHPDPDHMSGVFTVINAVKVLNRYDNGQKVEGSACEDLSRWYVEFFRRGNYRALKRGDTLRFGRVILRVLNSYRSGRSWNENSLVILLTYGSTRFLFMADAPRTVENELMRRGERLSADVLKVGHHGASDVLAPGFLSRVNPTFAVISINKNNIRGYPSKSTLRKLSGRGIAVFITYKDGTVLFESDGEGIRVKRVGK